jgi:hypothetical protein
MPNSKLLHKPDELLVSTLYADADGEQLPKLSDLLLIAPPIRL